MKQMQCNVLNINIHVTAKQVCVYFRGNCNKSSDCFEYPQKYVQIDPTNKRLFESGFKMLGMGLKTCTETAVRAGVKVSTVH